MQEINWQAFSDHSSDEEMAAELRKAGLSVSCKRKLSCKNIDKENTKKNKLDSFTSDKKNGKGDSEKIKLDLYKTGIVECVNINSLSLLDEIDGQLYHVPDAPSSQKDHVSSANTLKEANTKKCQPNILDSLPLKVLSSACRFPMVYGAYPEAKSVPKILARNCYYSETSPEITLISATPEPIAPVVLAHYSNGSKTAASESVASNYLPVTQESESAAPKAFVSSLPAQCAHNLKTTNANLEDIIYNPPTLRRSVDPDTDASIALVPDASECIIASQATLDFIATTLASEAVNNDLLASSLSDPETNASVFVETSPSSAISNNLEKKHSQITILENVPYYGYFSINKDGKNLATKNSKKWPPVTHRDPGSTALNAAIPHLPAQYTYEPETIIDPTRCEHADLQDIVYNPPTLQRSTDPDTDAPIALVPDTSEIIIDNQATPCPVDSESAATFTLRSAVNKDLSASPHTNSETNDPVLVVPSSPSAISNNTEKRQSQLPVLEDVLYHGDLSFNKKRKNKATKDSKKWQRNLMKEKRERGEDYIGYRRDRKVKNNEKFKVLHDVQKPARQMNPPCNSSFCFKSKLRACHSVSQESRIQLFQTFWKQMSWEQRRAFICSHVLRVEKKFVKSEFSNRTESREYFLTIDNKRIQVCKKMFLATLGVKEWFIRYWLKKTDCAMPPDSTTSQKGRKGPEKTEDIDYLRNYLKSLPTMPSHYCRSSTSRAYLEPVFENMTDLYKKYKESCEINSRAPVCRKLFDDTFLKLNLSLFHPKKDQCDVCVGHQAGNVTNEVHEQHEIKKRRAREEKATDKSLAEAGKFHIFTQDVESVKLVPFVKASANYYKTKLCVHNFTLYNLSTKDVICYWFDESNSTLEASVFATCLVDHLQLTLSRESLPIILYSDGCCAQNRNSTLSNALIRLAIENKVVIVQKYLEKGHTQMECDSVHSAIECKLKNKEIYLPDQYVSYTKKAREEPAPYNARLLEYNFFIDFSKDLVYKSIRPGKKAGDPVVTDIRMLEYRPDGTIWYKLDFLDEIKPLPQRPTPLYRIKPINSLPKLYPARLPISARKYQDLQDLKTVIPAACHKFYDDLPHL